MAPKHGLIALTKISNANENMGLSRISRMSMSGAVPVPRIPKEIMEVGQKRRFTVSTRVPETRTKIVPNHRPTV